MVVRVIFKIHETANKISILQKKDLTPTPLHTSTQSTSSLESAQQPKEGGLRTLFLQRFD